MNNSVYIYVLFISFLFCSCASSQPLNTLNIKNEKELQEFFRYTADAIPLVSGHRGASMKGYPENAIETFEYILKHTPAFFEIDPRLTKDSVIVLHHDVTLDRTTTGTGKLSDYTWDEVKHLKLKDIEGNITPFHIPTLQQAIEWARSKTILNLDKKDVPLEMTASIIKKMNAGAFVMVTVHNAEQAKFYYDDDSLRMMSAFVKTEKAFEAYKSAGIPWSNMIAYIGSENNPSNKEMYNMLHEKGVMCMISAAPVFDKISSPEQRLHKYKETFRMGADILESDLPVDVARALKELTQVQSTKKKFFSISKFN